MPGLISSAAGGKAAAPKAPPRRRAAPTTNETPTAKPTAAAASQPLGQAPQPSDAEELAESTQLLARQHAADGQQDSARAVDRSSDGRGAAAGAAPVANDASASNTGRVDAEESSASTHDKEEQNQHDRAAQSSLNAAQTISAAGSSDKTQTSSILGKRVRIARFDTGGRPPPKRIRQTPVSQSQEPSETEVAHATAVPSLDDEAPARAQQDEALHILARVAGHDSQNVPTIAPPPTSSHEDTSTADARQHDSSTATSTRTRKARQRTATPRTQRKRRTNLRLEAPAEVDPAVVDTTEAVVGENDPENHAIDPASLSMYHLSYDRTNGRMSERGRRMAEIDWTQVAQQRRDEAELLVAAKQLTGNVPGSVSATIERPNGEVEVQVSDSNPTTEPAHEVTQTQYNFTIGEDGEINLDDSTLTYSREADAIAAAHSDQPVIEENDLTRVFNRTTYINAHRRDPAERGLPMWKSKSDPWSEEETDRFYEAIGMFGTDFFIISKMFAPKTRRMIKMKFVREERLDPQRINDALLGRTSKPMDLEHFAKESGRDVTEFTRYEGIEHAENMIEASLADKETALTSQMQEEVENRIREDKERRAAKEKSKKKKKGDRRGRAKMVGATLGGGFGADPDG